jgi:hypothetical protein
VSMVSRVRGMHALGVVVSLGLFLSLSVSAGHAALIIDDFQVAAVANYFSTDGSSNSWGVIPSRLSQPVGGVILGNQRDVYVGIVSSTGQQANSFGSIMRPGVFDVTTGEPGTTVILQYDGSDTELPTGLPVNANALPAGSQNLRGIGNTNDRFQMTFNYVDPGNTLSSLPYKITVTGMVGASLTTTTYDSTLASSPILIPRSSGATAVSVPFASFPNYASQSALFGDVRSVEFQFNAAGAPNVDFQLTSLQTVPEPATIAVFATGAVGFGLVLWRRRRAQRHDEKC